jgi:hypothetical protein
MRREGYSLYEPSIYENHSGLLDTSTLPNNQFSKFPKKWYSLVAEVTLPGE